jgi:hypothetical protein
MGFEAIITIIPGTRYCGFQTSRFEVLYTAPLELPISISHKVSQVSLGSLPYYIWRKDHFPSRNLILEYIT